MRVTANTALSNIPSQTTVNSNSPSTASIIRNSSPSPFSSALLQQLSRSNTFQTFIHSLSNSSSSRNDGFDDLLNSRVLQQATTNRQSQPSRTGSVNLHRRSTIRDPSRTKRGVKNTNSTTGEFPLSFDIVYCDGGYYSEAYNVENILRNDNHVYCSSKSANINILLRFNDHNQDNNMETTFVLSKIIVKAPTQGYTAPCKEGLIFVSHEPISLEATSTYDDFTESDFQDLLKSGENGRIEDSWPAAYFRLDSNITMQTVHPNRSGKFIFVKLLRSEGDEENIDLQYLGFIGFTGPRSFDSGTLR